MHKHKGFNVIPFREEVFKNGRKLKVIDELQIEEHIDKTLDSIATETNSEVIEQTFILLMDELLEPAIKNYECDEDDKADQIIYCFFYYIEAYINTLVERKVIEDFDFSNEFISELRSYTLPFMIKFKELCEKSNNPRINDPQFRFTLWFFKSSDELSKKHQNPTKIINDTALTIKQQVLLMSKLGVFDLSVLEVLPTTKIGLLFGRLLNKNAKNFEDSYRNRFDKTTFSKVDIERVNAVLKEAGLEKL